MINEFAKKPRTEAQRREAARQWDQAYRAKQKEREKTEAGDEFLGDPIEAIANLILMLPSHRLGGFAREAIAAETDRAMEHLYSQNKSTVQQESFARLQESYARHQIYGSHKSTKHFSI